MPLGARSDSELLERDEARAWLERELEAARIGPGRLVAVGGEAGIGKTSLLRQFAAAHERDADVRWGACDPLATQRPLAPLVDIAHRAAWLELLERPGTRGQVFDALLHDLVESSRGALVVVEDVHWADDATLDLLVYLQRRMASSRSLVVITYRDDEIDSAHPLRSVLTEIVTASRQRLHLRPLSTEAIAHLAAGTGIDPAEVQRVTGGNPFFVTETLAGGDAVVAPSVRDAVMARARRLTAEARRALEVVAIVPGGAEIDLVEAVAGIPLDALDEPVERQMLRVEGQLLSFRHELARRAWLDTVPPVRLRRLHRDTLRWLTDAGRARADHARLAHHAVGSTDPNAILQHASAAAAEAASLQAHREAAQHYSSALEHAARLAPLDQAALLSKRAYECYLTDQMDAAVDSHEQALVLWRQHGDVRQVGDGLRWSSRLAWLSGRGAEALRRATEAVELLEPYEGSAELANAYSNMSQLYMLRGDSEPAIEWGGRAIRIAEELDDEEILAHALNNVGSARMDADDSGRPLLERSLTIALAHGMREHVARAYTNLGSTLVTRREYEPAAHFLLAGIDYCAGQDLDTWLIYMTGWLARERFERGRWDEAVERAQQVLNRRGAAAVSTISALVVLARVRTRRGDPDVGALLDRALELAEETDEIQRLVPVAVARAEAAWHAGRPGTEAARVRALLARTLEHRRPWLIGELALWVSLVDKEFDAAAVLDRCAEPFRLMISGDHAGAARRWTELGCAYEAADSAGDSEDPAAVVAAHDDLVAMGARPRARQVAERLRTMGRLVPRGPTAATRRNPYGLTDREVEVAREIAIGGTDQEIAARLHISRKTASHHVSHILTKLGARNRAEAASTIVRLDFVV